ncbi:MAG TPA: hypothetical protein VMT91_08050 [Anaerolineales bacterium]|nr:hypothetical protein [Anaerolineales bacterium]
MTVTSSKRKLLILLAGVLAGMFFGAACSLAPMLATGRVSTRTVPAVNTSTRTSTFTHTPSPSPTLTPTPTSTPTTQNACPSGNCAYACVSKLRSFLNGQPLIPPSSVYPHPSRKPNMTTLVTYRVDGDRISSPVLAPNLASDLLPYQADSSAQQRIWDFFAYIIPAAQRSRIKTFVVATDGSGGFLASIGFSTADLSNWQLTVDIVDSVDPTNMTYTMLHEFGHLLTLNDSQLAPDVQVLSHPNDPKVYATQAATCSHYLSEDGCSKPDSYINAFYQKFWVDLFPAWEKVDAITDPLAYNRQLALFYYAHQDQFVTPYSSTSPEEDIAESWAHFIFDVKPNGNSIARQKLLFFYNFPDLVSLRSQIVNNICLYSQGK